MEDSKIHSQMKFGDWAVFFSGAGRGGRPGDLQALTAKTVWENLQE